MSIQDLGAIGELIAAIATLATLVYLAIQVRLNTRALKAQTFEHISSEMGQNVVPILMTPDMAGIFQKGQINPDNLTNEERMKLSAMHIASFRRLESVFVQTQLGTIDREYAKGFENSLMSIIQTPFGQQWWQNSKAIFFEPFANYVDQRLASGEIPTRNPAIGTTNLKDDQ